MGILLYPYFLILFWYRDFFFGSLKKSYEIFRYITDLLSLPLLVSTFFKPLKNEYHEGLIIFSVIMGMIVKSILIFVSVVILLVAICLMVAVNVLILLMPLILVAAILL